MKIIHSVAVRVAFGLANMMCCLTLPAASLELPHDEPPLIRVAVASNFVLPAKLIAREFEKLTQAKVQIISGSTGKIYAQILHGAPYDVFLSADQKTILKLKEQGLIIPESHITYAKGRIVLWPSDALKSALIEDKTRLVLPINQRSVLNPNAIHNPKGIRRIALANPRLAPYGQASHSALTQLMATKRSEKRLNNYKTIYGENILQAYQFVQTGSVDMGFVALSQVIHVPNWQQVGWLVPQRFHRPILQDAAIVKPRVESEGEQKKQLEEKSTLMTQRKKSAVSLLISFLKEEKAKTIITDYGYQSVTAH